MNFVIWHIMSKIIKIKKRSFMRRFYAINLFGIIITCLVLKYRNWMKAYYNIRFEKEAYAHQNDMEYFTAVPFRNRRG